MWNIRYRDIEFYLWENKQQNEKNPSHFNEIRIEIVMNWNRNKVKQLKKYYWWWGNVKHRIYNIELLSCT